ncbi:uncharacterized protein LOC141690812 [Apium graveolens]|uniref:uncharacterized protein LOC141690812 n=1 Tax=Apium graveolens TaxID=4045 RepID=UPI003D792794
MPIPQRETEDKVAWTGASNGVYSAKSGYRYWYDVNFGAADIPQRALTVNPVLYLDVLHAFWTTAVMRTVMHDDVVSLVVTCSVGGQQIEFNEQDVNQALGPPTANLVEELSEILGVHNEITNTMYLGLPSLVDRSKNRVFGYLKDEANKRIQKWSAKLISQASKAVLVRNIAQAIPSYTTKDKTPSFIWVGIHTTKEVLCKAFKWVIGNGDEIISIKDPWLKKKPGLCVDQGALYENRNEKVSSSFLSHLKYCNAPLIRERFLQHDAYIILAMPIPQRETEDKVAWTGASNGVYSAKSGYRYWYDVNFGAVDIPQSCGI